MLMLLGCLLSPREPKKNVSQTRLGCATLDLKVEMALEAEMALNQSYWHQHHGFQSHPSCTETWVDIFSL